ncbi:MAG: radical SAM protein, partial [Thalassobaculaceae bacterium]
GGEPFMNPQIMDILELCLARDFKVLVLTNAMKPMAHKRAALAALAARHPQCLTLRVSVDHYTQAGHEAVRGADTWAPMCAGLTWLATQPIHLHVAARLPADEEEAHLRAGFQRWFDTLGLALDADDPVTMMAFPEMDENADVPEITTACWDILGTTPSNQMCASSRMVVKAKGAAAPHVVACTLLPYDPGFNLGPTLAEARRTVALNHRHCAKFCVLGGAACSA